LFVQDVPHAHHPRHHYRLAAALAEAGFDVTTLAPPDLTPGQPDAVPVEYLPWRRTRLGRMTSAPLSVLAAARRGPACVHVVSLDLLPWAVILRLTRRCAVLYDSNEEYDSMMMIKEWLPPALRPVLRRVVRWAEPWLAARLDAATTALPATQEKFVSAGVRSVLVRNFPPVSLIAVGDRDGQPAYDVLVGGSLPEDQIPLLAATAVQLQRIGVADTRWLVAARAYGPRERELLETTLERAGVQRFFELRYNVPFADMRELMARSRIGFILYPGDVNYSARIPIRLFEYMAAGLPFVASDLPTTAQFARGKGVGLLVPPGDPEAYARAIAELLADPEQQAAMSRRGPVLAREEYSWQVESRKLVALYQEVLADPRRRTRT
jgi:glycosyltransferase involved in cell wall biosynthesis